MPRNADEPAAFVEIGDRPGADRPMVSDTTGNYLPGTVFVCASVGMAAALARHGRAARRTPLGLFDGYTAEYAGNPFLTIAINPDEHPPGERDETAVAHACLRQVHILFPTAFFCYIGNARAVSEDLRVGDVARVRESIRIECPLVITDDLLTDRSEISSGTPPPLGDHVYGERFTFQNHANLPIANLVTFQPTIHQIAVGTSRIPDWRGQTAEYLRQQFKIDAVEEALYGAAGSANALKLPFLPLIVVSAGRSARIAEEFRRERQRFERGAAAVIHSLAAAALKSSAELTARGEVPSSEQQAT